MSEIMQLDLPFAMKESVVMPDVIYPIVDENNNHIFSLKILGNPEYRMVFDVWEFETRGVKGKSLKKVPSQNEHVKATLYMTGEIAWDGQSHIVFPENGRLFLSGAREWARHCSLMISIYKLAGKLVLHYSPAFGGDFSKSISQLKIMNPISNE